LKPENQNMKNEINSLRMDLEGEKGKNNRLGQDNDRLEE